MSADATTLRAELWAVLDLEPQSDRDLVETVRNLRAFRDERHRIVLRSLDEARAELARRDTTIAAALGKCDETAALAFQAAHGNQMHTTTMYSVTASIRTSTIRELLSASDETDPRADCGCCDGSWRLCRGLVDKGMARCCADCTHDLSAPVEAGAPAKPVCGDVMRWAGYENVCHLAPHEASEVSPHESGAGTRWWPNVVEAGAPAAEPAPDRPGICPTCESSQPHLHPHRDLCSDPWHKPIPTTVDSWRREVARWADLLYQVADFNAAIGNAGRAAGRIGDDMRRALAGAGAPTEPAAVPRPPRLVAELDGQPGCPVERWDGPYRYRCGLGTDVCAFHGRFVVRAELADDTTREAPDA